MNEFNDASPAATEAIVPQTSSEPGDQHTGTEMPDFAFIDFAKRYIGLLATVAAIPLISTVFGVLVPPDGNSKLPVLTSLTCLVTFAACFQLRDMLSYFVFHKLRPLHLVPFLLVLLLISAAVPITAGYYVKQEHWARIREQEEHARIVKLETGTKPAQPTAVSAPPDGYSSNIFYRLSHVTNNRSDWLDVTQYILIHPLFILALGIILVTSFTQNQNVTVLALLESQFSDGDRNRLLQRVRNYVDFDRLATEVDKKGCSALRQVGKQLTEECDAKLHALSRGCIEVPARETRYVLGLLFQSFHKRQKPELRFDAVSDRDLDFWIGADDPQTSDQYFRLNVQAVCDNIQVSRIFILNDEDLINKKRRSQLVNVLRRHHEAGIAWAIALYNEIDPKIRQANISNDFGLFNGNEVVSFFRDYSQGNRKSTYIFRTEPNAAFIDRQRDHYKQLLNQCWMASSDFDCVYREYNGHGKPGERENFSDTAFRERLNKNVRQILEHTGISFLHQGNESTFLISVLPEDDMAKKVDQLAELREASRTWYGENINDGYDPFYAVVPEADLAPRQQITKQAAPKASHGQDLSEALKPVRAEKSTL